MRVTEAIDVFWNTDTPDQDDLSQAIDRALLFMTSNRWIPVKASLPEKDVECLATVHDGFYKGIDTAKYVGHGVWEYLNGHIARNVTAWKYYPEPYNESED